MPRYFASFIQVHKSPGLLLLPTTVSIATAIDDLLLIWHLTDAAEWINRSRRLPL